MSDYSKEDDKMVGGDHYTQTELDPWAVIRMWVHNDQNRFEAYLWGNALKYLHRYRRKGKPMQDIDKAIHYLKQLKKELAAQEGKLEVLRESGVDSSY